MSALICPAPGAVFAATALPLPHCQSVCAPLRSSSVTCGKKSCLSRLATTNKKKWQWALNAANLEAQAPTPPLSIDGDDEEEEEEEEEEEGEEEELQDFSLPAPELQMSRRKKLRLILNTPRKQKVVLKFLWLEKSIGIGLDQVSPGYGAVPLSPYFFWPRKDAWEELKSTLESKPWISRKRAIILLNQATDIINLWQQRGADA